MKKLISVLLLSAILMAACNNNKTKDATNSGDKKEANNGTGNSSNTEPSTNDILQSKNDMAKLMEEMKKMPALSTDQLKAMLPETMMDMKRSNFSVNSGMGFGVAEGSYKNEVGSKRFRVQIYDCAGAAGTAYYSMMYWGMNMEQEDENGYKKSTTFNGEKAIESYNKNNNEYGLLFPASNRLLVNVEGENTGLDSVKQAAKSLNLKVN